MGSKSAPAAVLGFVGLLAAAGCADPGSADYATICATKVEPIVRVDDRQCPPVGAEDQRSPWGWYYMQLPAGDYDEDTGGTHFTSITVVDVGGRVYPGSGSHVRPRSLDTARTIRPPARSTPVGVMGGPGATAGTSPATGSQSVARPGSSSISRGGLGVSGVGGSSGS